MKPPNVDRFIAEAQGDAEIESVEVYISEPDERRRPVRIRWAHIGLVVAFAATAALVITSLSSGRHNSRPGASTSCVHAAGYGGLGARTSLFDANNNYSTSPSEPTPGGALYVVTGAARGCVTSFSVAEGSSPPLTAHELVFLVTGPFLPRDAKQVVKTDGCAAWRSAALRRATGRAYATASAVAQAGDVPGRAAIEVTSSPRC